MVDHALHLAMVLAGVAAFLVAPLPVAIPIFAAMSGLAIASFVAVRRTLRLPPKTGSESLIGDIGTVVEWQQDTGLIRHRGELWRATGMGAFEPRVRVRIVQVEGTVLHVASDDASKASLRGRL